MLGEHRITQSRLARAIGMPPRRISEIVRERRAITADTALRLGRALGTTAQFWLRLQEAYDLERAYKAAGEDIDVVEPLITRPAGRLSASGRPETDPGAANALYAKLETTPLRNER